MTNNLGTLNSYLFSQLDRLDNEELSPEEVETEVQRSKAMMQVSNSIIQAGKLVLDAQKYMDDRMDADAELPKMLEGTF